MEFTLALLLYVIVQFIAFLFVLVGTPIDMFRPKDEGRFDNSPCITLWGYKDKCYSRMLFQNSDDLWSPCPGRGSRFRVAQALVIISIFVYGTAAAFGFIMLCCCSSLRLVCLALNITGVITLCVVWASMVKTYYTLDGQCFGLRFRMNFGSGFALLVFAWVLDIINIVLLLLPSQARDPSEIGEPIKSAAPTESKDAKE
ncbi:Amastin surface glycoprotein, putative [Leishmania lindenbergi]|uniref:Amastin surface glycoprotein n=1 Tax=Leishmania lindenbergi TaxID=651832 RepID=A0AAW3B0B1_9TRYP